MSLCVSDTALQPSERISGFDSDEWTRYITDSDYCINHYPIFRIHARYYEGGDGREDADNLHRVLGTSEAAEYEWEDYCVLWAL